MSESSSLLASDPPPPDVVYHYTDGNGLLGILKDRGVRCTHFAYLNDNREFLAAFDEVKLMLKDLAKETAGQSESGSIAAHAQRSLSHLDSWTDRFLPLTHNRPIYVTSFSGLDDDLSQWRGYPGVGGPRFSLGFSTRRIRDYVQSLGLPPGDAIFSRVLYGGTPDVRARIRAAFLGSAEAADRRHAQTASTSGQAPLVHVAKQEFFRQLALMLKDGSFKGEDEYRLCLSSGPKVDGTLDYRVGRSFLVPFVLARLIDGPGVLTSVTIGPTPHPAEAEVALKGLLRKHVEVLGDRLVTVRKTSVPFRDWH